MYAYMYIHTRAHVYSYICAIYEPRFFQSYLPLAERARLKRKVEKKATAGRRSSEQDFFLVYVYGSLCLSKRGDGGDTNA